MTVAIDLPGGGDFAGALEDREEVLALHRILHTLPEPYKEVFGLRVFGELPFRAIGQVFGKTEGWARVTYYRAKSRIDQPAGGFCVHAIRSFSSHIIPQNCLKGTLHFAGALLFSGKSL